MEKPNSMTLKEWLVKKIAIDIMVSERVINNVIIHQFESATKAFQKHNSVEFSGFGKFLFNIKKANKKLEEREKIKTSYESLLSSPDLEESKRKNLETRLASINKEINILKEKLYEKN